MKTETITIGAPNGLHARPAGELVRMVKSFDGTGITLATKAKKVNAASILSVLSLGLKAGTEVEISAEGPREEEALAAVVSFLTQLSE